MHCLAIPGPVQANNHRSKFSTILSSSRRGRGLLEEQPAREHQVVADHHGDGLPGEAGRTQVDGRWRHHTNDEGVRRLGTDPVPGHTRVRARVAQAVSYMYMIK